MLDWFRKIKAAWSWARFAWQLVIFFGLSGLLASVVGSIWAVILGVPLPIALMVGYCTLVGAVYLAMAPLAYRALAQSPANTRSVKSPKRPEPPNYPAVRLMHQYSLQAAGKLWADVDQNAQSTYDSESWFQVLKGAIQRGELLFESAAPRNRDVVVREQANPGYSTIVTRKNLQKFAVSINQDPTFLRDA